MSRVNIEVDHNMVVMVEAPEEVTIMLGAEAVLARSVPCGEAKNGRGLQILAVGRNCRGILDPGMILDMDTSEETAFEFAGEQYFIVRPEESKPGILPGDEGRWKIVHFTGGGIGLEPAREGENGERGNQEEADSGRIHEEE